MQRCALALAGLLLAPAVFAGVTITVHSLEPDSPALQAGLRVGDRLVLVGDRALSSIADLRQALDQRRPGDALTVRVDRDGELVEVQLVLGGGADGEARLGVGLEVELERGSAPTEGGRHCLDWIGATFRPRALAAELGIALETDVDLIESCVVADAAAMGDDRAARYCDNIFKVHCSGMDLLAEVAEAQIARCERALESELGIRLASHRSWRTCAENEVYERYAVSGESIDTASCRRALLQECGSEVEVSDDLDEDQRRFFACCRAESIDAASCGMIDDGFARGPCLDRTVCVNRHSGDWLTCAP